MTIGLRSASVITVTNSAEFDYVKKVGFSKPIFQLKNGIGRQTFDQLSVIGPKEPSKTLHVVYVGTVGIAQNLITLVRAASKLPEVNFTIVGEGIELSSLREECLRLGLDNVNFAGAKTWHELLGIYAESDLLYGNISFDFATAVPSKIFEYVSAGRP